MEDIRDIMALLTTGQAQGGQGDGPVDISQMLSEGGGEDMFRLLPRGLEYFYKDYKRQLPAHNEKWLNWGRPPALYEPGYNGPQAWLTRSPLAPVAHPEESTGYSWHGYSHSPEGQPLKDETHPTAWRADQMRLRAALDKIFKSTGIGR